MSSVKRVLDSKIAEITKLLNEDRVREAKQVMEKAWKLKPVERPPITVSAPSPVPWPKYPYVEAFYDKDKMLLSELSKVYVHLLLNDDAMPCVRANYGVGIIASGYGCEIVVRDDQMPWVKAPVLKYERPRLDLLKRPDPWSDGLMKTVLETETYFLDMLKDSGIKVYLCDTQGPLDVAYLIRGSKIYRDFIKFPDKVHDLLQEISETIIEFTKIQKELVGEPYGKGYHGTPNVWMAEGGIRICEDVAVTLSPKAYREYCKPYNSRCAKPFNGGMYHFCCSDASDGKQIISEILKDKMAKAFFFGSPDKYYPLKETLAKFCEAGKCLIWTDGPRRGETPKEWIKRVADAFYSCGTGLILSIGVSSYKMAVEIMEEYNKVFNRE